MKGWAIVDEPLDNALIGDSEEVTENDMSALPDL